MAAQLNALAAELGEQLMNRQATLVTAESCTGGWIAKVLTDIPGSSAWFDRGFVTYSNAAKQQMLGVREQTLSTQGAVSAATVSEMAKGALAHSDAALSVAVSGVAGPGGGTPEKPVGTVWLAWSVRGGKLLTECRLFSGDRTAVRRQTVERSLHVLLALAKAL